MSKVFLSQDEIYLFNNGEFFDSYLRFGSHVIEDGQGVEGVHFACWAPNAKSVRVVGDFNSWDINKDIMERHEGGVFTTFIPSLGEGEKYKYQIETYTGEYVFKSDPYAFWSEVRPHTASIVRSLENKHKWGDAKWYREQRKSAPREKKMLIYEVHLSSWKVHENGNWPTYREYADMLIPYVKDMGYTHIELMPLTEHPFDGSWGYQATGYYSATSRYGTPEDLMFFVDMCHQNGIGVIMDWVPGHFCKDAHGLGLFDGTPCFEAEEHLQWGTYKFDFSKKEVRSFLISNALFWIEKFHFDGLRVDGVSSMLHLDFDREEFEPNIYGGRENLEAIQFLKDLNRIVITKHPTAMMIAEESTDWPMVTKPAFDGGLGFTFKWNMGWMNDTLKYMETWFEDRRKHHDLVTFSMMYAFSEEFILPMSHDEVVHGKCSLVNKMPGDNWQKFANYRAMYMYQMAHPGKKLTFMGCEFAQYIEWKYYEPLEWFMLDYPLHRQFMQFTKELNHLYLSEGALWQNESSWDTFEWLDADNNEQAILSFVRRAKGCDDLIVVINFRPEAYDEFRIGVPCEGTYVELFNTDKSEYGGAGYHRNLATQSEAKLFHKCEHSIKIKLPPLGAVVLKREKKVRKARVTKKTASKQ